MNRTDSNAELSQALALYKSGHLAEAEVLYRRLHKRRAAHPEALYMLGVIAFRTARNEDAVSYLQAAVAASPDQAPYHLTLGVVLDSQEQFAAAEDHLQRAVTLAPQDAKDQHASAHRALGDLYRKAGRLDRALASYRRNLDMDPRNAEGLRGLGVVLYEMERTDTARACLEQALLVRPDYPAALVSLGILHRGTGDAEEAREAFQLAVQSDPACVAAHHHLAQLSRTAPDDPRFGPLEELADRGSLPAADTMLLHFTLGKMHDDAGRYDAAFAHFAAANRLRTGLRGGDFRLADLTHQVDSWRQVGDRQFFARRAGLGPDDPLPVLVVGMPRSGTTLLERIIASHPHAFGAGELPDLDRLVRQLAGRTGQTDLVRVAAGLTAEQAQQAAAAYLVHLRQLGDNATRVVDKMPQNFLYLGLVALLLPGARVIHVRRNALDTCLSCFTTDFATGHGYRNELRSLGLYYRQYWLLMDHWRQVLPLPILEVDYEKLVADQEGQSRRLIEFCGLEWDETVHHFQHSDQVVRTASSVQVRQRLYRSAVGRWRHYADHLEPLREALGPELVAEAEALTDS